MQRLAKPLRESALGGAVYLALAGTTSRLSER